MSNSLSRPEDLEFNSSDCTVNLEIFVRILFSRVALKDIMGNYGIIYVHQ